jgi:excisionase family DNA binding protein
VPSHSPRPLDGHPPHSYASIKIAAEYCDVDPRTIRRWIDEGRITGYRVGPVSVKVDLYEVEAKAVQVIPPASARIALWPRCRRKTASISGPG